MTHTKLLENYDVITKIGEGTFSEVLKVFNTSTGQYYAAKLLNCKYSSLTDAMENEEIAVLKSLEYHPNVISIIDSEFNNLTGKLILIFHLMDMNMYDYIKNRKRCLSEIRVKNFLYQLVCGLKHLHCNGIFHRDIKPENILIKINNKLRNNPLHSEILQIADLGSVCNVCAEQPLLAYISTRWYRAPECLLTSGYYNAKIDIWALGCVFYEILTLHPLFPGKNELDQLFKIHDILGTPPLRILSRFEHRSLNHTFPKCKGIHLEQMLPNLSSDGIDVLYKTLAYHPDRRISIHRLINHVYFNDLRQNQRRFNMKKFSNSIPSLNLTKNYSDKSFPLSSSTTISSVEPNLFKTKNNQSTRSSTNSIYVKSELSFGNCKNNYNLKVKERTWGMNPGPRKEQLIRSVSKTK